MAMLTTFKVDESDCKKQLIRYANKITGWDYGKRQTNIRGGVSNDNKN